MTALRPAAACLVIAVIAVCAYSAAHNPTAQEAPVWLIVFLALTATAAAYALHRRHRDPLDRELRALIRREGKTP
ncbi:hypothetical protein RM572_21830 [Streptomyces sp. DSM 42041]|uniref:DUF4229 domain-containing protein n=1 Tax=Streptomyces hazeniae TaxID=3075538 RepID=A0ABU2NWN4_9ACTN|nr:hypothetical protein [Streptomyces sp. DSM 42041]MDT0381402.1 hypothetical protein [Streptomyces sp. DSM 42041]